MIKPIEIKKIVEDYIRTRTRLILLDYDGTLVPFDHDHRITNPSKAVVAILHELAADPRNNLMLISGRKREYMEKYFNDVPMTLVAEHGGYYKKYGSFWNTLFTCSMSWVPQALAALQALVFEYEGSIIEQKTFSLAWHYRKIADRVTNADKGQILSALKSLPESEHFIIYDNEFTIELRTPEIDKGAFISRWVGGRYFDFIMSIGDSQTDEDVFRILGDDAHSIKVGAPDESSANYYIKSQDKVLPFLSALIEGNRDNFYIRSKYEGESVRKSTS